MRPWRQLLGAFCWVILALPVQSAGAAEPLQSGVPVRGVLAPLSYLSYYIDVPAGASVMSVRMEGESGDVDLFVHFVSEPQGEGPDFVLDADFLATSPEAVETIEVNTASTPPLGAGRWYVIPYNWNETATAFELTVSLEVDGDGSPPAPGIPLPVGHTAFPAFPPIPFAVAGTVPGEARPIGVGAAAEDGDTVFVEIRLERCSGPADIYFGLYAQVGQAPELILLGSDGALHAYSSSGLFTWKSSWQAAIEDRPLGEIARSALPPGRYFLYLMLTPAGTLEASYLWSTYFDVPGGGGSIPVGSAGFTGGRVMAPGGQILSEGRVFQGEAEVSGNALVAVYINGEVHLYHPALGTASLCRETSRLAVRSFLNGILVEDLAARDAAAPKAGYEPEITISPGQSVTLGTGFEIAMSESGALQVTNQKRRWAAVVTDSAPSPYFFVPRGLALPTNALELLDRIRQGRVENLVWSYHSRPDVEAGELLETFGAFWRGFKFSGNDTYTNQMLIAVHAAPDLIELLNDLDFTFFAMDAVKAFGGLVPWECSDLFINLAHLGVGSLALRELNDAGLSWQGALWKNVWDGAKDVIQSGAVCIGQVLANAGTPATGLAAWLISESVMLVLDIITAADFVVEDVGVAPTQMQYALKHYEPLAIDREPPETPDLSSITQCFVSYRLLTKYRSPYHDSSDWAVRADRFHGVGRYNPESNMFEGTLDPAFHPPNVWKDNDMFFIRINPTTLMAEAFMVSKKWQWDPTEYRTYSATGGEIPLQWFQWPDDHYGGEVQGIEVCSGRHIETVHWEGTKNGEIVMELLEWTCDGDSYVHIGCE